MYEGRRAQSPFDDSAADRLRRMGLTDEAGKLKKEFTVEGIHMFANGYEVVLENMRPFL